MKTIFMSFLYFIVVSILMSITYFLFALFCNSVLLEIFNWFNGINIFWKLIILFLGGLSILAIIRGLFVKISNFINCNILSYFPNNTFTILSSLAIFIINLVMFTKDLWNLIPKFTFWITLEFIFIISFFFTVNSIFVWRAEIKKTKRY